MQNIFSDYAFIIYPVIWPHGKNRVPPDYQNLPRRHGRLQNLGKSQDMVGYLYYLHLLFVLLLCVDRLLYCFRFSLLLLYLNYNFLLSYQVLA